MSLLPGQILPPTEPFGKVNADGTVTIDKNWWLLLYNLCLQTLSTGNGIPAAAILDIESTDVDVSNTDAAALRSPVNVATLLATDNLLPDPPIDSARLLLALAADPLPLTSAELPGGFGGFANPTAKVALTVVNGTANTAMRSDASPPIDQSIAPTWTGTHTWNPGASLAVFLTNSTAGNPLQAWSNTANTSGARCWTIRVGSGGGALALSTATDAGVRQNDGLILARDSSGNFLGMIIPAPSSGQGLQLTGTAAGTAAITINTSGTTGAQTASFAATNKPGAASGSPQKWLPIIADGTTYYIPLFS